MTYYYKYQKYKKLYHKTKKTYLGGSTNNQIFLALNLGVVINCLCYQVIKYLLIYYVLKNHNKIVLIRCHLYIQCLNLYLFSYSNSIN